MTADIPAELQVEEPKPKFPALLAAEVALEVRSYLEPTVVRLSVAGSLRRLKPMVGDVEIIYIPGFALEADPGDLFGKKDRVNLTDRAIEQMMKDGILEKRVGPKGGTAFGQLNKLMVHVRTGVPVDLFRANKDNFGNYMVCRTGPRESNIRICTEAQRRGWKWRPYGDGFTRGGGPLAGEEECRIMATEEEVFRFVGLPYLPPEKRK